MTVHVAYLAGIIDGEGSVMLIRTGQSQLAGMYTSWTPKVQIANTDLRLLTALQSAFGGVIKATTKGGPNWKPGYRLEWYGPSARDICLLVFEHLIVKREQATIVMQALSRREREGGKGKRKTLDLVSYLNDAAYRIRALNQRGVRA